MGQAKKSSKKKNINTTESTLRLDLGCGINKLNGYIGVDSLKLPGVDQIVDLTNTWPWKDGTVDEVHCSHTLEHFTQEERIHVMNELYRVLKPVAYDSGGKVTQGFATFITPAIFADRAYGDPTHKWPAIGDWFYLYLNQEWRDGNAPHADIKYNKKGYSCNFERTIASYNTHQAIQNRNQEYQQHALIFWKEAAQDIIAQLVKR